MGYEVKVGFVSLNGFDDINKLNSESKALSANKTALDE
jgi:hypothetical protein